MNWNQLLNSGRRRASSSEGDHRDQFERDQDRVVFSSPLKRLQDKAQVFPLETHDSVRNRLTHSLEVASVSRGIARKVCGWLKSEGHLAGDQDRQIETIATTCGLIHDLGNPPFGHAGETAIQDACKKILASSQLDERYKNDFLKFEGNAQSLRLVSCLQVMADDFGLNLTYGTLSASCKYVADSSAADSESSDHACSKPGFFQSEKSVVEDIRQKTGTNGARNPITFLVEAADDIVYSVADIEDAVKKQILSWEELQRLLRAECGGAPELVEDMFQSARSVVRGEREWPANVKDDEVKCSALRTAFIGKLVSDCAEQFKAHYRDIMDGKYTGELVKDSKQSPLVKALKAIGRKHIYCIRPNLTLELMGKKVISDLVEMFWEGAKNYPKEGRPGTRTFAEKTACLISGNYAQIYQSNLRKGELPEEYCQLQLVTDYICGMTDSFAKRLHKELTNG